EGPFDIVYLDPPYAEPVPLQVFRLMRERGLLAPDAMVVYEHAAKRILPEIPGYRSVREEVYGDVALAFLAPES
ncbi:MAG: RsmD family RNA methyltransferase, partial [Candidatus Cybelea sp.]